MSRITYFGRTPSRQQRPARTIAREALNRLLDGLLEQGRFALHQLQRPGVRDSAEIRALIEAGYLHSDEQQQLTLTPLALRSCEESLWLELFQAQGTSGPGRHDRAGPVGGPEAGDEARSLRPGEPLEQVDVPATVGQALRRGLPIQLHDDDVIVRPSEAGGRGSAMLLLDLSGSMARHGKFPAARRLGLALRALVRRRFPGDELVTAGFASQAQVLPGASLLEITPRDVGLYDPRRAQLRLRADSRDVPEHFTNIQAGLRLARRILRRQGNTLRQILLVTDGEPTAHLEGDELVLCYPAGESTVRATLEEARRCAHEGICVSVFGLVGEFSPPELQVFVNRLAAAGRGTALCCSPRQLADAVAARFLRNRTAVLR